MVIVPLLRQHPDIPGAKLLGWLLILEEITMLNATETLGREKTFLSQI